MSFQFFKAKSAASALVLAAALSGTILQARAEQVHVAVANFGEHPALAATIAGMKAALTEAGYAEGKDVVYDVSHTNFDATLVPAMIGKLMAGKPNVLMTITTPVSQTAKTALKGTKVPQVFAAVTDPVAAGLVPSWDKGGDGITGASDLQNADAVMALVKQVLPKAASLGVPYNPGEANDVAVLKYLEKAGAAANLKIVGVGVDSINDIQQRVASLKGKADILYIPASNLLMPAAPAISSAAREAGIPVLSADDAAVKQGIAVATVSVNYEQVGKNAGVLISKILKGADPATLPVAVPTIAEHKTSLSNKALKAFGLEMPAALKDCKCAVD